MKDVGVVIPVYANEDTISMVDRCIETLDIDPKNVLLVDNTPSGLCKRYEDKGFNISYHPENLGVARSWNLGIKLGHDWTLLVSCSERFPEGISAVIDILDKHPSEYIFMTMQGWHVTGVSQKLVEIIGYFDENFYPAYCEDTDYVKRMSLANIPMDIIDIPAYCQKTGIGITSGAVVYPVWTEWYWKIKWGAGVNEVGNSLPFGDKSLNYWPERTIEQIIGGEHE